MDQNTVFQSIPLDLILIIVQWTVNFERNDRQKTRLCVINDSIQDASKEKCTLSVTKLALNGIGV
jgi:hypothetical protein